jgi:GT2 family glycosyltransferase
MLQVLVGVRRFHKEPTSLSVSIIVVHYGSYDNLQDCLNSLLNYSRDAEIIVVDNADLPAKFTSAFPGIKLFRSLGNVGFGSACNRGARLSRGSLLVFLNNDIVVGPGWLDELLGPLSDPAVGAVSPLVVFRDRPDRVNAAGGDSDFVGLAWRRGIGESRNSKMDGDFFWLPGSCLAMRKEVFTKIGGFDPSFFLFLEDVDLSWRLRIAGYDLAFAPKAVVLHEWMASTRRLSSSDIQYLHNRNRLRLILKNYGAATLLRVLPVWLMLQLALLTWILSRRQGLELRAVLAGWLWNIRKLPDTIRARLFVQSLRLRKDDEVTRFMYRGIAGIHLALGTMKHPVFENYFNRSKSGVP